MPLSPLPVLTRWPLLLYPTLAVTATVFLNDNILEINRIDRNSMSPTLSPLYHTTGRSDYILFNKYSPSPKRGDVVSFWSPYKSDTLVVKRVIGVEGDTVLLDHTRRPVGELEGERWRRMGSMGHMAGRRHDEVRSRTGNDELWTVKGGPREFKVTVPFGHVWVEGDNRRETEDSNTYGPISKSLIQGRAMRLVWPPERFWSRPWLEEVKTTRAIPGRMVVPDEWEGV